MSDKVVNDDDFENYINNFFGYGNLDAELIFVGMEEGGGDEIDKRVKVYAELTSKQSKSEVVVFDVKNFHQKLEGTEYYNWYFNYNMKPIDAYLQSTWGGIIRTIQGYNADITKAALEFQNNELGTLKGNHCLLELFPLPAANINGKVFDKNYKQYYKKLSFFKELSKNKRQNSSMKTAYKNQIETYRVEKIQEIIAANKKAKSVIFYSQSYWNYWLKIMDIEWETIEKNEEIIPTGNGKGEPVYFYKAHNVNYYVLPHYTKWSITPDFCYMLGEFIRKQASE